jgi:hypothetical protein
MTRKHVTFPPSSGTHQALNQTHQLPELYTSPSQQNSGSGTDQISSPVTGFSHKNCRVLAFLPSSHQFHQNPIGLTFSRGWVPDPAGTVVKWQQKSPKGWQVLLVAFAVAPKACPLFLSATGLLSLPPPILLSFVFLGGGDCFAFESERGQSCLLELAFSLGNSCGELGPESSVLTLSYQGLDLGLLNALVADDGATLLAERLGVEPVVPRARPLGYSGEEHNASLRVLRQGIVNLLQDLLFIGSKNHALGILPEPGFPLVFKHFETGGRHFFWFPAPTKLFP